VVTSSGNLDYNVGWHLATNAVDGKTDTASGIFNSLGLGGSWLQVDLGSEQDISQIKVIGRQDGWSFHDGQFTVYTSATDMAGQSQASLDTSTGIGRYREDSTNANVVINALNQNIAGTADADTLSGNTGNDTLNGGLGNDTYIFNKGDGTDTIVENDSTVGNTDVLKLSAGISFDQLWFNQVGNDLDISVIGTNDMVVVKDWYSGSARHVEQIQTVDGNRTLIDTQVQQLVQAMASMTPLAAGQTSLPPAYQTALAPVLAASWQ
jgi:Ca2+-binding RTX toxin-like protein